MIAFHELTELWRAAGGRFHGPNIETGTMPESKLMPFLQALVGPDQQLKDVEARVLALRLGPPAPSPGNAAATAPGLALGAQQGAPQGAAPRTTLSPAAAWPFPLNAEPISAKVRETRKRLSPQSAWPFPTTQRRSDTK